MGSKHHRAANHMTGFEQDSQRRKRVVVYTPQVLGPTLTFVSDQARGLRRWDVTVTGRELLDQRLLVDDLLAPELIEERLTSWRRRRQQLTRRVSTLPAVVTRTRPDLIHAHFLTGGFDVMASTGASSPPLLVTAHGFDATWVCRPPGSVRPDRWAFGVWRHRLLRSGARFIGVSTFIRDRLIGLGADPERVVVHHTGVDTAYFDVPASAQVRRGILFVGRLVEKKGLLDLLSAAARLRAAGVDAPVTVVGDGPQLRSARAFALAADVPVTFLGSQPRRSVRDEMHKAAVLCAPSHTAPSGDREGFGMVLAEAQATGLPVVATTCGGMVDAVDQGRTGFLVAERDVPALAAALERCLTQPALWARLSSAARPWVRDNFDLRRQNARLENLYDECALAEP